MDKELDFDLTSYVPFPPLFIPIESSVDGRSGEGVIIDYSSSTI